MNKEDHPLRQTRLGDHGCISFASYPDIKYKWMLHESKEWFARAKRVQGPDWYWSGDVEPIEYNLDSLGFRNDIDIHDISKNKIWWLFDSSCPGLAPGVRTDDMTSNKITEYTGIPVYNMSIYGDRPEFVANNILELSKRWQNPPSKILLHMAENPTGTFKLTNTNTVKNLDYAGSMLKGGKDFTFLKPFEEQKISEGQHRLAYKILIELCKSLDIPLTWLYTGYESDITSANDFRDQDFIEWFGYASAGHFEKDDTFDVRQSKVKDMIIKPFMECKPPSDKTLDEVGRDLYHPSASQQRLWAQVITNHYLETKRNF